MNHVTWKKLLVTLGLAFKNLSTKIIFCNRIVQYSTKERKILVFDKAYSSRYTIVYSAMLAMLIKKVSRG